MTIHIHAAFAYDFAEPADVLIQLEAAAIPEQTILAAHLDVGETEHFARVPAQDMVGERIWLRVARRLSVEYRASVRVERMLADVGGLAAVPFHQLPGETVQYLMPSRYCPSDLFEDYMRSEFDGLSGGPMIAAMRDWIGEKFTYRAGVSTSTTTALESFVQRAGVCRDYAHVLVTLARAGGVPARVASVYAPDVDPQDFHAVAEVFLGGAWHLVDATGMATAAEIAKIGVGRDAADVAFLTSYGNATFAYQAVTVVRG